MPGVRRCRAGRRDGPAAGYRGSAPPWLVSGDLRALAAALAERDAQLRPGEACPTTAVVPVPPFWLVDPGGRAYQPRVPLDPCGQPAAEVVAAPSARTG